MGTKLNITNITLFFGSYHATLAGTAAAKKLKDYIYNTYRNRVIDCDNLNQLKEDLNRAKRQILAGNPRLKDIPVAVNVTGTGGNAYIYVNGEPVMTLVKCRGAIGLEDWDEDDLSIHDEPDPIYIRDPLTGEDDLY